MVKDGGNSSSGVVGSKSNQADKPMKPCKNEMCNRFENGEIVWMRGERSSKYKTRKIFALSFRKCIFI